MSYILASVAICDTLHRPPALLGHRVMRLESRDAVADQAITLLVEHTPEKMRDGDLRHSKGPTWEQYGFEESNIVVNINYTLIGDPEEQ